MPRMTLSITIVLILLYLLSGIAIEFYFMGDKVNQHLLALEQGRLQPQLSLLWFGLSITQVIFGPLVDGFGRRVILVICLMVYCFASLLHLLTHSNSAQFLQLLSASGCFIVVLAYCQDITDDQQRFNYLALMACCYGVLLAISPVVSGYFALWLPKTLADVVLLPLAVISAISVLLYFPDRLQYPASFLPVRRSIVQGYWQLCQQRRVLRPVWVNALAFAVFALLLAFSPIIFLQQLGMSLHVFAVTLLVLALAYALGAAISYRLQQEYDINTIGLLGGCLFLISSLLLILFYYVFHEVANIQIPLLLLTSALAMINTSCMTQVLGISRPYGGHAACLLQLSKYGLFSLFSVFLYFSLPFGFLLVCLSLLMASILLLWGLLNNFHDGDAGY